MTAAPAAATPAADPAALYAQGLAALEAKDRAAARQLLATVVMLDPQHQDAWLQLSTLMETVAQSIECLQHVIALNPTHTKARHWLRLARDAQSRSGQAEAEAELAPELPMDDPAAFTALDPADRPVPRLGRYLLDYGALTPDQLAAGLAAQSAQSADANQRRLLGDILLAQSALTADHLHFALREQARLRAEVAREQSDSALD